MKEIVAFRRIRRVGAAALAVVVGLGLTGCSGRGGGELGPLDEGGSATAVYEGDASFGFTFRCVNGDAGGVVHLNLAYHDRGESTIVATDPVTGEPVPDISGNLLSRSFGPISLHGTAAPMPLQTDETCEEAGLRAADEERVRGLLFLLGEFSDGGKGLVFTGCYRLTSDTGPYPPAANSDACSSETDGFFEVAVSDAGEASGQDGASDGFFIQLSSGYQRTGVVRNGNIRVDE